MTTTQTSTAAVNTELGGRYLRMLCNHLSRKLETSHTDDTGLVQFGAATCYLDAGPSQLQMVIESTSAADLTRLEAIMAGHLEGFAKKESITVKWHSP